ncbi:NAD-dependent epimerase/dehydratase family protein [Haloarcula amylovorans]|uniref:NAD-dependent epimerase/dehydratase family protein n=1 Tax=Haloarcula amylovorans TaxID=2562280 RepID=UPI0010761D57|nr:NAD(P)-dependent oxidoreductase [Halomicroarcula amylolytica]
MHVFVSGATGVLGRRLVERLADRGHTVSGLARDDAGADLVEARGGAPRRGDVLDSDSLADAMYDPEAVIHAATALPTATKPSDEAWARNDRVRLQGAKNLLAAAGEGLSQFLFPSVVWLARQPDGSAFDETATRHPDRVTQSAADVEDLLQETASERGFDATVLRCGMFYAPDGAYTRQFARNILAGDMAIPCGGLLGRRDAHLSLVHADDAARALADALDADIGGIYHVVDDERVTAIEYVRTFASMLDASEPRRVPAWLARFFVGESTANLLSKPMPTTAETFKDATGWEPTYPTYHEGLRQVVETWENDGTLQATSDGYAWAES